MTIKKGDSVTVISGADKGKKGTIEKVFPKTSLVVVSGVNIKKVHQKSKVKNTAGAIVEVTKPVHVSNVRLAK